MSRWISAALLLLTLAGCGRAARDPNIVVMLIESSPTSLDPRIGTDAQSEHIDSLLFDSLVRRDASFNIAPALAERWETPDPLTYIFHLRSGVRFHDGRPLSARDVKFTLETMGAATEHAAETLRVTTIKAASYATWASIETPDPLTLVVHLKKPDSALLWNVCDGAFGVVPYGSGRDFWKHPTGSGPFAFVSQEQDKDVLIRRAPSYWEPLPKIAGVRFSVVPDAITRALELEKGSADLVLNAIPADMLRALAANPKLVIESGPGTVLNYLVFNTRDPHLKDPRVRNAIAEAIDRPELVSALFGGRARLAESVLPPEHWAWAPPGDPHNYKPAAANALLDQAGYPRDPQGVRFKLTIKCSTDETTRLLAVVLQQQLARIGIAIEVRSYEFATYYSDLTRGAFQIAPGRWIGGNEAPDIFRYAYASASAPPKGANRGYYSNTVLDLLLADAAAHDDRARQQQDYARIQQVLAADEPSVNLWYLDTVAVYSRRLGNLHVAASGNFDFLRDISLSGR
jgi:peptide/nickel transport system substrate-binding protein